MRWAVGVLIDLAVGFFILWFGLVVKEAELRDVLPIAIAVFLWTALLLASLGRWWDKWHASHRASTDAAHVNAPHLTWSVVTTRNWNRSSYEVVAVCDVTGALGVIDVEHTRAESIVDVLGVPEPADGAPTTITHVPEQMELPLRAPFQPGGRFDAIVRCIEDDPCPGERVVTWYVAYKDDDGRYGYLSKCSARVAFPGHGWTPHILGTPVLDTRSRRERHEEYKRLIASERRSAGGYRAILRRLRG